MALALTGLLAAGCGRKKEEASEAVSAENQAAAEQQAASETEGKNEEERNAEAEEGVSSQDDAAAEALPAENPLVMVVGGYDSTEEVHVGDTWLWYASAEYDGILLLNPGYEKLQKALQEDAANSKHLGEQHLQSVADQVKESGLNDFMISTMPWESEDRVHMERCDKKIFSYVRQMYTYLGGAHPYSSETGYNYDALTGEKLQLEAVITDKKELREQVLLKLRGYEDADGFFLDWEDTVGKGFDGDPDYPLNWVLTDSGIDFIYNEYMLGPYAMGEIRVSLSYEEHPELFREELLPEEQKLLCHEIDEYGASGLKYEVDADGNGVGELLCLEYESHYNEEFQYVDYVTVRVSYGRDEESLITDDQVTMLEKGPAYIMETPDGRFYLYLDLIEENDWQNVVVYDLNDPDKGPIYKGYNEDGGFYGIKQSDPEHVYVARREYVMGTYEGFTECTIDRNGFLVPVSDTYRIFSRNSDRVFDPSAELRAGESGSTSALTLRQDITAECFESEETDWTGTAGTEASLPEGTKLYAYATDGENYMIFKLEDGSFVKLVYDKPNADSWERSIQGIPESELLDGILYAG